MFLILKLLGTITFFSNCTNSSALIFLIFKLEGTLICPYTTLHVIQSNKAILIDKFKLKVKGKTTSLRDKQN
jgi:hypothetical protein